MPIHSNRLLLLPAAVALLFASPLYAHSDTNEVIPNTTGGKVGLAAAVTSLSTSDPLPSQALPGYLLLGDAGVDRRGLRLEHGVVQVGYRFNAALGAELSLGAHGSDPVHVEAASLQWRGHTPSIEWTMGAGRQAPSLGPVMTKAGHLDRFGLMPLAKQAVTNGDWIDDGAQLKLFRQLADISWTLDFGLWRGRTFPGAAGSRATPSLHVGAKGGGLGGNWSLDAFGAQLKPLGRGSRVVSDTGAHSHTAPRCDASLNQIVCFDGHSRISGISMQWDSHRWPVTVSGAVMWRDEDGLLQSRNGTGQYDASTRGQWLQATWRAAQDWEVGLRHESLSARHQLVGPGAAMVASEAGLSRYAPQRRTTALLGYTFSPWADLRVEGGREVAAAQTSNFVALRLILQWERRFSKGPF